MACINAAPPVRLPAIRLSVKFDSGKLLPLRMPAAAMVEDVKYQVETVCGMPAGQQELWFKGNEVHVGSSLAYCGIESGAVLTLQFRVFSSDYVLLSHLVSSLPYPRQRVALVHDKLVFVWNSRVSISSPKNCMKVAEIVADTGAMFVVPGAVDWQPESGTLTFTPERRLPPFAPFRVYFYAAFFELDKPRKFLRAPLPAVGTEAAPSSRSAGSDASEAAPVATDAHDDADEEAEGEVEGEGTAEGGDDDGDGGASGGEEANSDTDGAGSAAAPNDGELSPPGKATPPDAEDGEETKGEEEDNTKEDDAATTPKAKAKPAAPSPMKSPGLAAILHAQSGILMGDEALDFDTGGFPVDVFLHVQALDSWFSTSPSVVVVKKMSFPVGIKSFDTFHKSVAQLSAALIREKQPVEVSYGALKPRTSVWKRTPHLTWEVGVPVTSVALMNVNLPEEEQQVLTNDDVWQLPPEAVIRVRGVWGYVDDVGV